MILERRALLQREPKMILERRALLQREPKMILERHAGSLSHILRELRILERLADKLN